MFQHPCDLQTAPDNALGATDHQAAPTTGEGVSREDQSVSRRARAGLCGCCHEPARARFRWRRDPVTTSHDMGVDMDESGGRYVWRDGSYSWETG